MVSGAKRAKRLLSVVPEGSLSFSMRKVLSLVTYNGHHNFQNGGYRRWLRLKGVQPLLQLLLSLIARRGRVELGQRRPELLHGEKQ